MGFLDSVSASSLMAKVERLVAIFDGRVTALEKLCARLEAERGMNTMNMSGENSMVVVSESDVTETSESFVDEAEIIAQNQPPAAEPSDDAKRSRVTNEEKVELTTLIVGALKEAKEGLSLSDVVKAVGIEFGAPVVGRTLRGLAKCGEIYAVGSKRWTRYSLKNDGVVSVGAPQAKCETNAVAVRTRRDSRETAQLRDVVLNALRGADAPLALGDVLDKVHGTVAGSNDKALVGRALHALVKNGVVQITGKKRGAKYSVATA